MNHKSQLFALLYTDQRSLAKRCETSLRANINDEITASKGVELKNMIGSTLKAGGKIYGHPESVKYSLKAQNDAAKKLRLNGLSGFGPINRNTEKISRNISVPNIPASLTNFASAQELIQEESTDNNLWSYASSNQQMSSKHDKIFCDRQQHYETI